MKFRGIVSLLAAGVASVVLANPALAQTTGGLSGQIIDANTQAPVAEAVVIATSPSLQGEQTAVTDSSGTFEITLLPAGVYTLNVQRDGYNPFTQSGLTIRLDKTIKVKLQLVPDSVKAENVDIVVSKPVITTSSAQTGASVSKEQMNLIPYGRAARNFEAVVTSVPGAHGDTYGISLNGAGSPETAYIIDGVQVNDPAVGTQGTTLLQDFVQEVDVKTGGYQAEYGRATGGIVNVVTKSGGNEFHGSVFVNWSPFEADRKQIGAGGLAIALQTRQRYNLDFGAEVGGPILKDKLWFFVGFAPQVVSLNYDRIIQARTDDGTGRAAIDPSTGAAATHEVARQTYANTQTSYQFTGKLTYLVNENHNIALAIYGNPTTTSGAQFGTNAALNEGTVLYDTQNGSTDVSLRYSGKLLNKTMLVEATLGYHHQFGRADEPTTNFVGVQGKTADQLKDTPLLSWRDTLNLLDSHLDDGTVPSSQKSAAVLGACAIQTNGFNPCPVQNYFTGGIGFVGASTLDRYSGILKLSNFVELLGHHQFKYGIDVSQDYYKQDKYYTGGQYFYAYLPNSTSSYKGLFRGVRGYGHVSATTPGVPAFQSTADGIIRLQDNEPVNTTKNVSLAFFAQDTWNILDKVVLDIGVRGESQKMYADSKISQFGGDSSKPGLQLTNFMPRVGLIYDWTGRGLSKVYASYGRFYEYVPLDLADRALSSETQVTYSTNGSNCTNPKDPRTCQIQAGGQPGGRTYSFTGGSNLEPVDPDLKGQYADEYQAGVQYQVYRDISVGVDYVRKQLGRVIEDMSVDDGNTYFISNPGESCSQASIAAGTCGARGVTGLGQVIPEPKPERIYDGVTLSVNKAFSDSYLVTASYTWSSFRGNYPGLFRSENGQLDPNILSEYDLLSLLPNKKGPLPGDVPNSFKVDGAYVYELDAKTTFNFGANFRADEGTPLNYLGAHPLYGPSEAFILPRGSAGRLPWTWSINARAQATYKMTKDYSLGLTVDLFNVTNNQQTTNVNQNYTYDSVSPIVNGTKADLAYLKNTSGAPVALNQAFLQPTAYQLPFSARVGAKLSF
jgi:Carboxypeptidase regulatory-like domain/TonB-dependent Receptor Plug Domain